jgi:hypothetical protein
MSTKDQAAFKKLSEEEQQLREDAKTAGRSSGMTVASRLVLFFVFPLCVGSTGLLASHLQYKFGKDPVPMNFDRDFVYPFLITVVLVVVVSIQTGNFSSYNAKPLVSWPKIVKKQKITRKTVIVDDDGNVIEDEDILKNLKPAKDKKDD